MNSGSNAQIWQSVYDKIPAGGSGVQTGLLQENLRKRVSTTFYKETAGGPVLQASYYSYDLTGNIKTLWQQVDGLALKKIDYEYDLVTAKTNFVRYQDGQNDRFYYAFKYDAENRLIESYTGTEALISQRGSSLLNGQLDAFYQYYLHGPLARTELGQNKVQGLDYAYTLQGWMKGINGQKLNANTEIGNDGNSGNNPVARDVMAYSLSYHQGDYQPIGGTGSNAFSMQYTPQTGDITGTNLFDGNISHTTIALSKLRNGDPVGYTYHYDQLNRLKEMRYHPLSASTATWNNSTKDPNDAYKESIAYDGNGNILTYLRNGANSGNMPLTMDQLTYRYKKETDPVYNQDYLVNNQLQQVNDAIANNNYSQSLNGIDDLDNQDPDNYKYDKTGNLVYDDKSDKMKIVWTVYGKMKSITKEDGANVTKIDYTYDAGGNRVRKSITINNVLTSTTWYSRDLQGNTLAIYSDKQNNQPGTWWKEQHLYGSSRIGMWNPGINISTVNGTTEWGISGKKSYELTNHLGNVLATITDKKIAVSLSGSSVDYYEAEVTSTQDYYPGGMLMPGRRFNALGRYGFSGKEQDPELKGEGNSYDFGERAYDARVVRWASVDAKFALYPSHSPYCYAVGNPILFLDPNGGSVEPSNVIVTKEKGTNKFKVTGDITIKIQLINLSSKSNGEIGIYDYKERVKNGLTELLNTPATVNLNNNVDMQVGGKGTASNKLVNKSKNTESEWTFAFNVNVQIEVINSKDQIRPDAHVLAIVDSYDPSPSKDIKGNPMITPIGLSNGDRIATVGVEEISNFKLNDQLHTALHELAHSLGVAHFWKEVPGDKGEANLMDYKLRNNKLNSSQLVQEVWFSNQLSPNWLQMKLNRPTPWSGEKEKFKTTSSAELDKLINTGGVNVSK
jgi:RHS repeat-associated protein